MKTSKVTFKTQIPASLDLMVTITVEGTKEQLEDPRQMAKLAEDAWTEWAKFAETDAVKLITLDEAREHYRSEISSAFDDVSYNNHAARDQALKCVREDAMLAAGISIEEMEKLMKEDGHD